MIEVIITNERINQDPEGRQLLDYIKNNEDNLGVDIGVLYYDFPSYSDYESQIHNPDFLLISKKKGLFPIKFAIRPNLFTQQAAAVDNTDKTITEFSSILLGRLLKSRALRASRGKLKFEIYPIVLCPGWDRDSPEGLESELVASYDAFSHLIRSKEENPLTEAEFSEVRSIIEGAKAMTRPQRRVIEDPERETKAVALSALESKIANFDERQRQIALSTVKGPQRIRGLAGSGKTVILAMKAAHLHLAHPDARILVTFYTRSLQLTFESLITRFYRHYKDENPDWSRVHVRHGWGSARRPGVYSDTCKRHGIVPLSFMDAKRKSSDPFDFACREAITRTNIKSYYDFILIDEGQDFPSGFYELSFLLAKGDRDRKNIIWAYDELQNILNVKIRSPEELFGNDRDNKPRIDLERASIHLPQGVPNDIVLAKCYRNQREVLVIAHALGFGIYREIVQLLQDEDHWRDVGYEVLSGPMKVGKKIKILRPEENSPVSIESDAIIECGCFANMGEEIEWITSSVEKFLKEGLNPHDCLVISLDDRHAKDYFKVLSQELARKSISTNNIIADPYREPDFLIEDKVTLSTVYRAKGNEAAVVFALGVDAIDGRLRSGRNKLFTAFTRSKAWLRVSGVGANAKNFCDEIERAQGGFPYLEFVMPDPEEVETIQRDLSKKTIKAKKLREDYIKKLRGIGLSDDEIVDYLSGEEKP